MDSESEPARQGRPQTHLDANADTWAAAVDMYRNRYSFLAVGPRLHEDWLPDVAAEWRSRLFEIPRSAVVRLLVMLATDGMEVSRQYGFTDRRMGMEEHAQVILALSGGLAVLHEYPSLRRPPRLLREGHRLLAYVPVRLGLRTARRVPCGSRPHLVVRRKLTWKP
ncbi:hypothetical protein [Streptomyces galilaeus]|uniref:hypothetical protein n=1 Tax=Streptomyces galilaeus TaxID=33899 RepID=UPI0019CB73EC|nr:hypothetical protein [Streptomyces galilaeus]GGW37606.1 hypothetical protein GCM10010350_21540 [Streptomyces galilaeus]